MDDQRLSERVATVMGATVRRLAREGYEVEWDATFTARMSLEGGAVVHDPAIAFWLAITETRSGKRVTTSAICDANHCTDIYVSQVTLNLWTKVRFDLGLRLMGFEEDYGAFDGMLDG